MMHLEQVPFFILLIIIAFISLCVGSFLNVVIYRIPIRLRYLWRREATELLDLGTSNIDLEEPINLSFPASHCTHCKHKLRFWHNIPVVSYILLKGKCAFCSERISIKYPIIEALTCILTSLIFMRYGITYKAGLGTLLIWFLIVLSFIDLDTHLLPDSLTLPLIWIGLIANHFELFVTLKSAVTGAIIGYLFLWLIYWIFKFITQKEGMGYGDFKLLSALGAWFGWQSIVFLSLSSAVIGIIIYVIITHNKSDNLRYQQIPFGPALAISGTFYLFYGSEIITRYLQWLN
ncbi:A24 family peptidase [Francisellaceae bacterium]|nr:A24 family peptidase [Francisellaceae bacterium]